MDNMVDHNIQLVHFLTLVKKYFEFGSNNIVCFWASSISRNKCVFHGAGSINWALAKKKFVVSL